jgi:hypothetical protein
MADEENFFDNSDIDEILSQVDEADLEYRSEPELDSPPTPPSKPVDSKASLRFVLLEESQETQLGAFRAQQENLSTVRKTLGHVKLFKDFLNAKDETRPMHTIPPLELDSLLGHFYVGVRKIDGA